MNEQEILDHAYTVTPIALDLLKQISGSTIFEAPQDQATRNVLAGLVARQMLRFNPTSPDRREGFFETTYQGREFITVAPRIRRLVIEGIHDQGFFDLVLARGGDASQRAELFEMQQFLLKRLTQEPPDKLPARLNVSLSKHYPSKDDKAPARAWIVDVFNVLQIEIGAELSASKGA